MRSVPLLAFERKVVMLQAMKPRQQVAEEIDETHPSGLFAFIAGYFCGFACGILCLVVIRVAILIWEAL